MKKFLLAGSAMFAATFAPAQAATITAANGFGVIGSSFSSCKDGSNSTAFATGALLSAGNWTGDSCVGYFGVALDTAAKTITLSGLEIGNYESSFFEITGISETTITALSTLSYANLFDPLAYGGGFATDVPVPSLSFTGSSIRIEFTSIGSQSGQFAFGNNGGTAVFSYAAGAVPEPATWAMMLAGFGAIGFAMRNQNARRRKVAVSFG